MSITNPTANPVIPSPLTMDEKKLLTEQQVTYKAAESGNVGIIAFGGRTFNVRLSTSDLALNASELEHLAGKVAVMLVTKHLLNNEFAGARINQKGIENLEGRKIVKFEDQDDPAKKIYQELTSFVSQKALANLPPLSTSQPSEQLREVPTQVQKSTLPKKHEFSTEQKKFFETVENAYRKIKSNCAKARENPNPEAAKKAIEEEMKWVDRKLQDIKHAATHPGLNNPGAQEFANAWEKALNHLKGNMQAAIDDYAKPQEVPIQAETTVLQTNVREAIESGTKPEMLKPEIKAEEKGLSAADKNIYRQALDALFTRSKQLAQPDNKHKKLLMKEGRPELVDRQKGMQIRKGTSENAKNTAKEVVLLLRTGLKEGLFTKNDVAGLKQLKENLSEQIGPSLAKSPELNQAFQAVFKNIEEAADSFQKTETYVDRIEQDVAKEGKVVSLNTLAHLLVQPGQTELRKDFLVGSGWMEFVRKDPSKAAGKEIAQAMVDVFKKHAEINAQRKAEHKDHLYDIRKDVYTEKLMLMDFAIELIQKGIAKKEDFAELIAMAKQDANKTVSESRRWALEQAAPTPMTNSSEILAKANIERANTSLSNQFTKLAAGKFSKKERNNFIKDFMADLQTTSRVILGSAHSSEFYGQAWIKDGKEVKAPNLVANTQLFNQVSDFVASQILDTSYNPKERVRVYEAFLEMADRFAHSEVPRNYEMAQAILSGLNQTAVYNTVFNTQNPDELSKQALSKKAKMDRLYSTDGSNKALREAYKKDQLDGIPFIPKIANYLTDFTFTDDGNGETKQTDHGDSINLKKLRMLGNLQAKIETELKGMQPSEPFLHFDLLGQVVKAKHPNEDELYARKEKLKPRATTA